MRHSSRHSPSDAFTGLVLGLFVFVVIGVAKHYVDFGLPDIPNPVSLLTRTAAEELFEQGIPPEDAYMYKRCLVHKGILLPPGSVRCVPFDATDPSVIKNYTMIERR